MPAARERLHDLVHTYGDAVPVGLGAALIADDEQAQERAAEVVAQLDALGAGLRMPSGIPLYEQLARLNLYLFQELGFRGDAERYDEPENSWLDRVLERRKGLPILLCIVYMEVAARRGIFIDGVGFPAHFLVRPRTAHPPFWLDPFHGGQVLREDELRARLSTQLEGAVLTPEGERQYLGPLPGRHVLLRVCNNLKQSWLRRRQLTRALGAVERMLVLGPELLEERRDQGLLLAELGRPQEALLALTHYLSARPQAADATRVRALVQRLRGEA